MIQNVQALRAVAACMVLLIHVLSTRETSLDGFKAVYWWLGPAGVDVFFVISGLIVSTTAARAGQRAARRREAVVPFALKRVVRIYPVYWVVLALAFLASTRIELAPDWVRSLYHHGPLRLALLATTENDVVLAAWTLCYEMYFYLVLAAILLIAPRRVFPLLAAWALAQAVLIAAAGTIEREWMRIVAFSPLLLEFALGCGAGYLVSRGRVRGGAPALALGLAWLIGGAVVHRLYGNWEPWWRAPTFGPAAALIAYGLVALEESRGFVLPKWLCRLGDPSYSIYIWHQLVLAVLAAISDELDLLYRLPDALVLLLWTALTLAVGFASYHGLERPLVDWLRRRLDAPRRMPAATDADAVAAPRPSAAVP
jgi:peptidoglycan/LPS O-acetylase OafA/YrhL